MYGNRLFVSTMSSLFFPSVMPLGWHHFLFPHLILFVSEAFLQAFTLHFSEIKNLCAVPTVIGLVISPAALQRIVKATIVFKTLITVAYLKANFERRSTLQRSRPFLGINFLKRELFRFKKIFFCHFSLLAYCLGRDYCISSL